MFPTEEDKSNNKNLIEVNNKKFKMSDPLSNLNHTKHLVARPPKQAYLYFPTENEICEIKNNNSNKIIINRRLFEGNVKYTQYELEKYDEFIRFSNEKAKMTRESNQINEILCSIKCHEDANDDKKTVTEFHKNKMGFSKSDLIRYLVSLGFDNEKTLQSLIDFHKFKKTTYPIELNENIKKILLSGFIYIHGRDNRFRPLIILNPNIFLVESKNNKNLTYNDWMLSVIYLLDYCIDFMLIPGQIENWNIICDMNEIALYSVPNDLKNLLKIIQQNYKNRLNTMYVVNLGTFAGLIWNVIKGLMDENIQKKTKMVNSKNNYAELYENINRHQLEVKYGGLAENIKMTYEEYSKNANNTQNINYNSNTSTNNSSNKINTDLNNDITYNAPNSSQIYNDFFLMNKFYFPPNMPSELYFTEADHEKIDQILIGEDEYKMKIKDDKFIVRSPFYNYDNNKDLRNFCFRNNDMINLEASSQGEKMVLELKNSHLILNDLEEFYSARDYMNADSSSIINSSIYPEIVKLRKGRENEKNKKFLYSDTCNIDDINYNSQIISFKKAQEDLDDDRNKSGNLIDLSRNNNSINKCNSVKSNLKNNKVSFIKKNKELDNSKNSLNNRKNKKEEITIDTNEEAKKCKMSCGQVKMECSVF